MMEPSTTLFRLSIRQTGAERGRSVSVTRCLVTVATGFGKSTIFYALPLCASTILEKLCDGSPSSSVPCVVVIRPTYAFAIAHFSIARLLLQLRFSN